MIFIVTAKFRGKLDVQKFSELMKKTGESFEARGVKRLGSYFTFGRFDFVSIIDSPNQDALQSAMKSAMEVADIGETETLIGLRAEEVLKPMT